MTVRNYLLTGILLFIVAVYTGGGCGGGGGGGGGFYIAPAKPFPGMNGASTTVPAGKYNVTEMIYIDSGETLTLDPGVTLIFAQDIGIEVWSGGTLIANATDAKPVKMTGKTKSRGFWRGVYYDTSNSAGNVLNYVTIEYAGGWSYTSGTDACVMFDSSSTDVGSIITNCTLQQSAEYGLYMDDNTAMPEFESNTITDNALGAAWGDQIVISQLTNSSTYSGNTVDYVYVQGDYSTFDTSHIWHAIDIPYLFEGQIYVAAGGALTIRPGSTLVFRQHADMYVEDTGALTIAGIESQPVLLTGFDKSRGYWDGIYIVNSDSVANIMTWTTVEYAGGTTNNGYAANIWLDSSGFPVRLLMANCTIREGAGYGLWCDDQANLAGFSNNAITANDEYPVYIFPETVHQLDTASDYSGNTTDYIFVQGGYTGVTSSVTWQNLNVDYNVDDILYSSGGATLTIAPGTTLVFSDIGGIEVWDDGALNAVGTTTDGITFTGETQTAGAWYGIYFVNSNQVDNVFDYVTVEYGGGTTYNGYAANIWLDSSGFTVSLTMTNSLIQHSAGWGMYKDASDGVTNDVLNENTWNNNPSGDLITN
jgi:hypothetical protein